MIINLEDYEIQGERFHIKEILIIAYDREYVLLDETPNKSDFYKYQSKFKE